MVSFRELENGFKIITVDGLQILIRGDIAGILKGVVIPIEPEEAPGAPGIPGTAEPQKDVYPEPRPEIKFQEEPKVKLEVKPKKEPEPESDNDELADNIMEMDRDQLEEFVEEMDLDIDPDEYVKTSALRKEILRILDLED